MISSKIKSLSDRPTLKKVIANSGWLMADRFYRLGLNFFVSLWVARFLGPENFGILNYVIGWSAIFTVLATLGIEGIVVRELVKNKSDQAKILGSTLAIRFLGALVGFLASVIFVRLLRPGEVVLIQFITIYSLTIFFFALDSLDLYFQAETRSSTAVLARTSAFTLVSLAKVFLILTTAHLLWFIVVFTSEAALTVVFMAIAFQRDSKLLPRLKFDPQWIRTLAKFTPPLVTTALFVTLHLKVDQLMLHAFHGERELGLYSAAVKLVEIWYFIPMILAASALPSIVEAFSVSRSLAEERLQKVFDFSALFSMALALFLSVGAAPILQLLYGSAYDEAASALRIYAWCLVPVFIGGARNIWITAENHLWFGAFSTFLGAALAAGFSSVLIPKWGIEGAAISALVSMILSSIFTGILHPLGYPMLKAQLKALFGNGLRRIAQNILAKR